MEIKLKLEELEAIRQHLEYGLTEYEKRIKIVDRYEGEKTGAFTMKVTEASLIRRFIFTTKFDTEPWYAHSKHVSIFVKYLDLTDINIAISIMCLK